eukprot:SAG31_NODE_7337_length_1715_cov_59.892327_2_plen_139_part_00
MPVQLYAAGIGILYRGGYRRYPAQPIDESIPGLYKLIRLGLIIETVTKMVAESCPHHACLGCARLPLGRLDRHRRFSCTIDAAGCYVIGILKFIRPSEILFNTRIQIRISTDHHSLQYLKKPKQAHGRIARWSMILSV